jgi:hypothetical protein
MPHTCIHHKLPLLGCDSSFDGRPMLVEPYRRIGLCRRHQQQAVDPVKGSSQRRRLIIITVSNLDASGGQISRPIWLTHTHSERLVRFSPENFLNDKSA